MSIIGDRIKYRRKELNLTQEQLANRLGYKNKATIGKIETGVNDIVQSKVIDFAKALNTTPAYLMGWVDDDKSYDITNINPITKVKIPMLGEIACGKPILCNEDRESYVEVGAEIHADFCLRAKGDSMIGARIYDGDIVFIREQSMVENGDIAAVVIDDEATLKRVSYDSSIDELRLIAENPNYKTMIYHGEELNKVRILGKAIAFQGDVK